MGVHCFCLSHRALMVCTLIMGLETFFWKVPFGYPSPAFIADFFGRLFFQNFSFLKRTGGRDSLFFCGPGVLFGRVMITCTDFTSFFGCTWDRSMILCQVGYPCNSVFGPARVGEQGYILMLDLFQLWNSVVFSYAQFFFFK